MSSWNEARSVLCVRLDSIGDVLMTTPAIRAVKDSGRGRRVTLLTSPAGAEAGRLVPEVDDVLSYDAPWMKATAPRRSSARDREFGDALRARRFDAAVIFTVFSQSPLPAAFLCFQADIPLRLAHCRENPYQLLTDWVPESEPQTNIRHEVQRQLDLVQHVGFHTENKRLSCAATAPSATAVRRRLVEAGLKPDQPWVVLHPGATAPSRRYPIESYAKVANELSRCGYQIVITGADEERPLIESLLELTPEARRLRLIGCLTLSEMAALIQLAPVLVTNNTGPAHIAAAVGTPVVGLYALTNPQHTPWEVPQRVLYHDVDCKYCFKSVCPHEHHDCLRRVLPETVVQAALELYHQGHARSHLE